MTSPTPPHSHRRPSPDWIFRAHTGDAALKPFEGLFGDPLAGTMLAEADLRHITHRLRRFEGIAGMRHDFFVELSRSRPTTKPHDVSSLRADAGRAMGEQP